jgi:hypothetical protein
MMFSTFRTIEPFAKLKPGEQRVISIDVSALTAPRG